MIIHMGYLEAPNDSRYNNIEHMSMYVLGFKWKNNKITWTKVFAQYTQLFF